MRFYIGIMNGIRKPTFHAAKIQPGEIPRFRCPLEPLQSAPMVFALSVLKKVYKKVNLMQQKRIQTYRVIIYRVNCVI